MIVAGGVVSPYTVAGPLMDALQITLLVLVAAMAACVVLIRTPARQVIALSVYGLMLALLFLVFQAPDVTLSELMIGAIGLPLFLILALTKVHRDGVERQRADRQRQEQDK
jgi:uncharacterized MnhB-related membrane protein